MKRESQGASAESRRIPGPSCARTRTSDHGMAQPSGSAGPGLPSWARCWQFYPPLANSWSQRVSAGLGLGCPALRRQRRRAARLPPSTPDLDAPQRQPRGRRAARMVTHADEPFDFDGDAEPWVPMLAGAVAGAMEHMCMYPVDTVKTRMQAAAAANSGQPVYSGVSSAFSSIVGSEGFGRLYRGIPAVVLVALPSHAMYFASYEFWKAKLGGNGPGHNPTAHAVSGMFATAAHDAIVTPVDVVKQRLQLYGSEYRGISSTVRKIAASEGWGTFYASYPTTLVMNVPFISAHFVTYEFLKRSVPEALGLGSSGGAGHGSDDSGVHLLAGAGAGAVGGLVSNPFDVIKTRIQTNTVPANMRSLLGAFRSIMASEGAAGFATGLSARMLYFTPSAAITWTTYEAVKRLLALG